MTSTTMEIAGSTRCAAARAPSPRVSSIAQRAGDDLAPSRLRARRRAGPPRARSRRRCGCRAPCRRSGRSRARGPRRRATAVSPTLDARARVIGARGADVDPEALQARAGRAVLRGEMDRSLPTTPGTMLPSTRAQLDVLADQHLRIPAAQRTHAQLPAGGLVALLDVRHDQADLVDVPEQQHGRAGFRADGSEARAEHVVVDACEALGVRAPDLRRGSLVPGWAVGAQQVAQEAETFGGKVRHGRARYPDLRAEATDPR